MNESALIARIVSAALVGTCAVVLSGCSDGNAAPSASAPGATGGSATVVVDTIGASRRAVPTFHAAPIALETPSDADRIDPSASAHMPPHRQRVPAELSGLSTRRLSREVIDSVLAGGEVPPENDASRPNSAPAVAAGATAIVYTPAQTRAAYNLPPLPAPNVLLTSAQAAAMGAGQTIYIVDAGDDPNVVAELTAYDTKFGIPACASAAPLPPSTTLPLAPQPTINGCILQRAYATPAGAITSTAPAFLTDWNIEIAADVELAHATAPLARIVLIEAVDDEMASLIGGITLANSMGPGVVSMSFGGDEAAYTQVVDGIFTAPNMTYTASAGDSGYEVLWPSSSAHVVGVGGTSLTYTGVGPRSEVLWYLTGGGVSQYMALPAYQNTSVLGLIPASGRIVSDVAFNADPQTGQYVDYYPGAGSTAPNWLGFGGTSAGAPQWAGLLAVANAERALKPELPLGDVHALLYATGMNTAIYDAAIFDITSGHRGSCAECIAGIGYDGPTGLGTPNATSLLATLVGNPVGSAPVVTPASVEATSGVALAFQATITSKDPLSVSLIGAPAGAGISNTGLFTWPVPIVGTYSFTVQAVDATNNLYGHAMYTVTVSGPQPPDVPSASLTALVGQPLNYTIVATLDSNPLTYSASNAPSGFTVTTNGIVGWQAPVPGTYPVTIRAVDAKTGLSGTGILTVTVPQPAPPTVIPTSRTEAAGTAFAIGISFTLRQGGRASYSATGLPAGVTIAPVTGTISGTNKVAVGNYSITVTLTDTTTGLSGSGVLSLSVVQPGPSISAVPITGVAGKALSGSITVYDPLASSVTLTITGLPAGLTVATGGAGATLAWKNPVTGSYALSVKAVDSSGYIATTTVPVTITAH